MTRHVQMIFAIPSVYVSYHFMGTLQSDSIKTRGQIRGVLTKMKIKMLLKTVYSHPKLDLEES